MCCWCSRVVCVMAEGGGVGGEGKGDYALCRASCDVDEVLSS